MSGPVYPGTVAACCASSRTMASSAWVASCCGASGSAVGSIVCASAHGAIQPNAAVSERIRAVRRTRSRYSQTALRDCELEIVNGRERKRSGGNAKDDAISYCTSNGLVRVSRGPTARSSRGRQLVFRLGSVLRVARRASLPRNFQPPVPTGRYLAQTV